MTFLPGKTHIARNEHAVPSAKSATVTTRRPGVPGTAGGPEDQRDPQVEVYPVGAELPTYQRLAKAYASLIWASTPWPRLRMATVFDAVDPRTGPRFADEHERLDDEVESGKVTAYLYAESHCW